MTLVDLALGAINRDRLEKSLVELIQNPSVDGTAAEAQIAIDLHEKWTLDGLQSTLHELDLTSLRAMPDYPGEEVARDRAVCTTATFGNDNGPHILLLGHTDVVPIGVPEAWTDDFFNYDYIGATWDDGVVGNGGFSWRSRKLYGACIK